MNLSCSICKASFHSPRDLGNHILKSHCDNDSGTKTTTLSAATLEVPSAWSTISSEATPIPAALKAIQSPTGPQKAPKETEQIATTCITLPRPPTAEEIRQKFLIQRVSDVTTRYICLICSKVYTSRYNIRMHKNMHTGDNVHTCNFCGRFFAHKHVFDSHVRTHTGERPFACKKCGKCFGDRSNCTSHQKKCKGSTKTTIISVGNNNNSFHSLSAKPNGFEGQVYNDNAEEDIKAEAAAADDDDREAVFEPQIVSVQSIGVIEDEDEDEDVEPTEDKSKETILVPSTLSTLDVDDIIDDSLYDEDLEEIQIEPDIIDYDNDSSMDVSEVASASPVPGNSDPIQLPQLPVPLQELGSSFLPHACSFCPMKFADQPSLISHLSEHIKLPEPTGHQEQQFPVPKKKQKQVKHPCHDCGKTFLKPDHLNSHLKVHKADPVYKCRFCPKSFKVYQEFDQHCKQHNKELKFKCMHCNQGFTNNTMMLAHQRKCSMNLDIHRRKTDKSEENLDKLDEDVHVQENKVTTSLSRITTRSAAKKCKDFLNNLKRDDTDNQDALEASDDEDMEVFEEPKKTKITMKPISTLLSKPNQSRFPLGENYVPDNNSSNVISKEEIEPPPNSDEKKAGYCFRMLKTGQQRIVCITCGKHYTTMYNMRQHRNIHTGKNLYSCRYCGKEFTHKHVWETHERIHTGERPFVCQHCGKDFADRSNYNSHRKLCATLKRK